MIKVNTSQFNYQYGNQIHFPYSIASLVSYVNNIDSLKNKFKFEKTFVFRTKVDEYIYLRKKMCIGIIESMEKKDGV